MGIHIRYKVPPIFKLDRAGLDGASNSVSLNGFLRPMPFFFPCSGKYICWQSPYPIDDGPTKREA